MSDKAKKWLFYGLLCPFFFLFALIFGAYWTFPYDHARDFIVQEVERDGTQQLTIGSLSPSWLTGVTATDVSYGAVPDDPDDEPAELVLSEVNGRISLLSLMGGETSVDYDAAVEGGGTINGNFAQSETQTHIDAALAAVDLGRIGPLRSAIGIPIAGRADGNIDLTIAQEAAGTEGTARLTVRNVSLADGETPLVIEGMGTSGLTLERMNLGTLEFRMTTERGTGRIERLHADGEHATLNGTGSIRLALPLARSAIDMLVRIKFKDAYRTSSPRMEGLFALLEANPMVRPARTSDGAFQWRIQGSFGGRIRMVPSGRTPMPEAEE